LDLIKLATVATIRIKQITSSEVFVETFGTSTQISWAQSRINFAPIKIRINAKPSER